MVAFRQPENDVDQLITEVNLLLDHLNNTHAFPTAEDVRAIVRGELHLNFSRRRLAWLITLGVLIPLGLWFGTDLAERVDTRITEIGRRIGEEAVRSAEAESGLPFTAGGREQLFGSLIQTVGRTGLGRQLLSRIVPSAPPTPKQFMAAVLDKTQGLTLTVLHQDGGKPVKKWNGVLRKEKGSSYVLDTTDGQGNLGVVFALDQIEHFQCSETDISMTISTYHDLRRKGSPKRITP
jgi:hypothetical protein